MSTLRALVRLARPHWVELVLVGLTVFAVVEALASDWGVRAHAALLATALLAPPPLLLRRRYPVPAVGASLGVIALMSWLYPVALQHLTAPFFIALAATVAGGAAGEAREAYVCGALTLAAISIIVGTDPEGGFNDLSWLLVFFGAAWLVGRSLAVRGRQAAELRERAERLERGRTAEAERAVEEERGRIARELHDVVAHSVSVMVVQAGGVRRLLQPDQEREREALLAIESTGRQALTEMRRMLGVLQTGEQQPGPLAPQPGLAHLDRLLEQVRAAGLPVELRVEGAPVPLPAGVDLSAYRIVQEGLANTLRSAGPHASARVVVRYEPEEIELEVWTDAARWNGDGHGLVGMRERVALYGGTLDTRPGEGGGFSLLARLPVEGGSS